jgi:hypothetical protein
LSLTAAIQALLAIGLALFVIRRDWENTFLTITVMLLTIGPSLLRKRYRVVFPPEFQFISAAFVFLSLFLGSATDFYYKYWWWDMVLHTSSGFLLGIVGFLALFLLNQTDKIPQGMKPGFLCFFAVTFAVTLGVVWEIFEFVVDRFTAANMQSTETGVVDTMEDLIVDTLGAIIVASMGGHTRGLDATHSWLMGFGGRRQESGSVRKAAQGLETVTVRRKRNGGWRGDRTPDIQLVRLALSQLSYPPTHLGT